jgi:mannosyltransferase OCH1-like enzyme
VPTLISACCSVTPPHEINGKALSLAAHQSDFMRLDYLIETGGIYLDWDYLTVRSFDDLLASTTIMGLEKHIGKLHEVIGVAVMMSRARSQFFRRCVRCFSPLLAVSVA